MAGRKKVNIDWGKVADMGSKFCTGTEIAAAIGIHYNTLEKRCKTDQKCDLSEFLRQKRERGKNLLRAKQIELALEGDRTMLVWLGKQYLGQSDKREQEIKNTHEIPQFKWASDDEE